MCTCAEGYSSSLRFADRLRTIEAIERKLRNPQVPPGKRERLRCVLKRMSGKGSSAAAVASSNGLMPRSEVEHER